ncbi:MAG: DNA polymerase IV [Bacilli bacterium]|nr:DNA polymerase IV [Bacilli bacterium]
MANVIMHVDLNSFFATCEQIRDPSLNGKPLMIGGFGRRGVVSTCSYEARKYGVHSGMPSFKALELCPKIIIKPGDYHYYSLMSKEFFAYCRTYTNKVEEASIDECYMDITNLIKNKDINVFLKTFQKGLYQKTKLKCSIGVGPTRFLAKMGSDYKKPMGITIMRKRDIKSKIYPLSIENFYGIGMRTTPHLKNLGIRTIGDLSSYLINKEKEALSLFGKYYYDLLAALNGTSDNQVHLEIDDPKSIGNSMTLMMDTTDEDEITNALLLMSKEVSSRLKNNHVKGKTIQLVVKDADFKVHQKSLTLPKPINSVNEIKLAALNMFNKYFKGITIRLVGVTLSNLVPLHEDNVQLSLFEETPEDKINDLINQVNRKFKKNVVGKASLILKEKTHEHK